MPWVNGEEIEDVLDPMEAIVETMDKWQRTHWKEAVLVINQPDYKNPVTGRTDIGGFQTAEILDGGNCIYWGQRGPAWPFEQCTSPAGHKTDHEGVGLCREHGGNYGRGKVQGAIMTAHAYADELNVTPWEALLAQVRLLYAQVQWLRWRVAEAEEKGDADALRPGGAGWDWVTMLEARGERLAKVSKMAIDAGVAERLIKQIELEGEILFKSVIAGLDAAQITGEAREKMLEVTAQKMLELESAERK